MGKEADPRRDRGFARLVLPFPYEKPLSAPENLTLAGSRRSALPTTPKKPLPESPALLDLAKARATKGEPLDVLDTLIEQLWAAPNEQAARPLLETYPAS